MQSSNHYINCFASSLDSSIQVKVHFPQFRTWRFILSSGRKEPTNLFLTLLLETSFSNSLIIHEAKTKENHKHDGFGNMIKHLHKLANFLLRFLLKYVHLFEKLYQTLTLVVGHVSKHLELWLKNSAAPRFSTSILGVWKHDQTLVIYYVFYR